MNAKTKQIDHNLDMQIERFYDLLLGMYNQKIKRARDKAYVRKKYVDFFKKSYVIRVKEADFYDYSEIIDILDDAYKTGSSMDNALMFVRRIIWIPLDEEIEIMYNHKNTIITNPIPTPRSITKYHQYSKSELLWLFARHKAYCKFILFLFTEIKIDKGELVPIESNKDEKNTEHTTIRQVLFMKYVFEALGVHNTDKTIQRNIIKFLTNKNDDNIYERLRNPYSFSNVKNRDNLRFIRPYFEDLRLKSVVDKINKEINYDE